MTIKAQEMHFQKGEELPAAITAKLRSYRKTAPAHAVQMDCAFSVETLEGTMIGQPGDYLMVGAHGELYPCAKAVFDDTYEPVEAP
jgi:hypothetical protein